MTGLAALLAGAVAMAYAVAGIFFMCFWARARDGLFLIFAVAFWLFAANQALVGVYGAGAELDVAFYSLRLTGFLLIIIAILRKNLEPRRSAGLPSERDSPSDDRARGN
jgi:hypothetical protein